MGAFDTWDGLIRQAQNYGPYVRSVVQKMNGAGTVAGVIPAARFTPISLPASFGTGVTGVRFVNISSRISGNYNMLLVGLEYFLGSLNLAGSFTDGVPMPIKKINGESIQTASMWTFLSVTTALTASATLSLNYTNETGLVSHTTSNVVFPLGAPVGTSIFLNPSLQGGDFAVRDVTNMTKVLGTTGVISCYGFLPLHFSRGMTDSVSYLPRMADSSLPFFIGEANESIGFMGIGREVFYSGTTMICNLYGLAET